MQAFADERSRLDLRIISRFGLPDKAVKVLNLKVCGGDRTGSRVLVFRRSALIIAEQVCRR